MAESTSLWCLFRVADVVLAAGADQVVEVSRSSPVTPIPLARGHVSGLVNVRGQIAHVVDLSSRLELGSSLAEGRDLDHLPGFRVVVRTSAGLAAFLVDEVCDVRPVPMADVKSPPAQLPAALADVTLACARTDAAPVVLLVDVDEVVGCA